MPFPALLIPLIFWTAIAAFSSWAVSRALPLRASHTITINAPVEKVWELVSDPQRVAEWNEHIVYARPKDKIAAGTRLIMKAKHPEAPHLNARLRPQIEVFEPNAEVAWKAKIIAPWVLSVSDSTTLHAIDENHTEVTQTMAFSGFLSPGVPFLTSIESIKETSNKKLKALLEA